MLSFLMIGYGTMGVTMLTLRKRTIYASIVIILSLFSLGHSVIAEVSMDINIKRNLVAAAIKAQSLAYAPYSNYFVGAALLTRQGEIISASNVENASYGLSICAERNAVFKAVTDGKQEFIAIAVVAKDGGFSCGACRQVLNEFNPNMLVIVANNDSEILKEAKLNELLPHAFGPANLGK